MYVDKYIIGLVFYFCHINSEVLCEEESNKIHIYSSNPISNIPVLDYMDFVNISCEVNVIARRGDYEPASIILRTREYDVNSINVEITNLTNKDNVIENKSIEIKAVKLWCQAKGSWKEIGRPTIEPDKEFLVPELLSRRPR